MVNITNMNVKKDFTKQQACFAELTPEEIEGLASLLVEKHFSAGQLIVTEGDPVDSVYLIVEGTADVRIITDTNNPDVLNSVATLGPGQSIGLNDTGFYSLSGKRTATVIAITDMVLLYLSLPEFHGFALSNHHVSEVMRINAVVAFDNEERSSS